MGMGMKSLRVTLISAAICALFVVGASAASLGVGVPTDDGLRLRAEPSTAADIKAIATLDSVVVVLEPAVDGWYKVDFNTTVGYMSADYLTVAAVADKPLGYGIVDTGGDPLNLRAGAGTDYNRLASIPSYTALELIGINNGWYKVNYGGYEGYVSSDYIKLAKDAVGARNDGESIMVNSTSGSSLGASAVALARQYTGVRYVLGGAGPNGFDCSGLVYYVYKQLGYTLQRGASSQYRNNGTAVGLYDVQPGDLVFFNNPRYSGGMPVSHVGIYIGNGQFIHASTSSYVVRVDELFTGHYANYYMAARRIG